MAEKRAPEGKDREGVWKEIQRQIGDLTLESEEYTEEELKDLLYRRALELSRVPDREAEKGERLKLVTFRLGSDHYGVSISMVREIQKAGSITPPTFLYAP